MDFKSQITEVTFLIKLRLSQNHVVCCILFLLFECARRNRSSVLGILVVYDNKDGQV